MEIPNVSWAGPHIDDPDLLATLPVGLRALLASCNGFILFGGGLHVRGACRAPAWHSLWEAWHGSAAFHRLYPNVDARWVPFAEDCVGDQFFLRDDTILRLEAEIGEVEDTGRDLTQFMQSVSQDPAGFLLLHPLLEMERTGDRLAPGQLIHAYPPFCTEEAQDGVSLRPVPAGELHRLHADFARKFTGDGRKIEVVLKG